jgi:serine/threonine-protein kinase
MPKTGELIAAKYRIEQLIGVGGMGAVFSATHQFTGKRIALKWMLPELAKDEDAVQRFMREARAAGRISHPNVVDVYDVGQHDESYFLVMEYLQGEPLTSALARRDLTPSEVLRLLLPAMRGVAAAHRQGVVHRDLKPDNIFLAYEEDGVRREAKVLDFGISKLSSDDQPNMHLTRTGAVIGTPYYMSPEQIRGKGEIDRRADIYAFGVILYEALAGQVPFTAETYGALVLEIATGTPKPLQELVPTLPAELSRIVLRAMAREASARYPTMEDLLAALEPWGRPSMDGTLWRTQQQRQNHLSGERPQHEGMHVAPTPRGLPARTPTPVHPATPLPQMAPAHVADTKPFRASTPFAAEATRKGSSIATSTVFGFAGFIAAAAAIVGAIWYLTRDPEPEPIIGMPAPAPLGESKSAASAAEPVEELPRGVSPNAITVTAEDTAAPSGNATPSMPNIPTQPDVAPVLPQRAGTYTRGDSRRDSGHRSSSSRKQADVEKDIVRRAPDPPEPTPAVATPVAPEKSQREQQQKAQQQRARSGTLNVNEF